jgi:hypothetical protein
LASAHKRQQQAPHQEWADLGADVVPVETVPQMQAVPPVLAQLLQIGACARYRCTSSAGQRCLSVGSAVAGDQVAVVMALTHPVRAAAVVAVAA